MLGRTRMIRFISVGVLVVTCAACGNDSGPPFVGTISRSQFFEYHDQVDETLCPTLLSQLDQHAQQIGGKVGFALGPGDAPLRYYKFRDENAFLDAHACLAEAGGCTNGNDIFSPMFFHAHEQSHDYVFRAWGGWSTELLNEGEAVALSCDPFSFIEPGQSPADVVGQIAWRDQLALTADSSDAHNAYIAAGYFVTYLVQQFGWPNLEALHRSVPYNVDADAFDRAFAAIYPLSMDEAWANALGASGGQPCLKDWLCDATPLAVGDIAPPSCDGQVHRSVAVTDQTGVGLSFQGGNGDLTLIGGCTDAAPTWLELIGGGGTSVTHWVSLTPGTYTLGELLLAGAPPTVSLAGYLPDGFPASTCESAGAVALDPVGDTFFDFQPGVVTGWMGVTGGGGQPFNASTYGIVADPTMGGVVEVCDGCDPSASCVSLLSASDTASVTLGDSAVVHLANAAFSQPTSGPANPGPFIEFSRAPPPDAGP
jgi:hypothetical protein